MVTPTANYHQRRLARTLSTGSCPILLEGPTSSGKTTIVEYRKDHCGATSIALCQETALFCELSC